MDQKAKIQNIKTKLQYYHGKIGLLLPMIRTCKDELNELTLQEMEIRSAIRTKTCLMMKLESQEAAESNPPEETPDRILGLSLDMDIEEDADAESADVEEVSGHVDYREFLKLDPNIVKVDSEEEDDDSDVETNENCENVFLCENDDDAD